MCWSLAVRHPKISSNEFHYFLVQHEWELPSLADDLSNMTSLVGVCSRDEFIEFEVS